MRLYIPVYLVSGFYFGFIVLSLVLLLNLLIAQMSDTYDKATDQAEQRWRWEFARRILRLETLNTNFYVRHARDSRTRDSRLA